MEEYTQRNALVDKKKAADDKASFFSPDGRLRIPGSSLRGMTRTLFEIASWGKMRFIEDRRLYYRGVGDIDASLRNEYKQWLGNQNRQVMAGYLRHMGAGYVIVPARSNQGQQIYRIDRKGEDNLAPIKEFYCQEVFFLPPQEIAPQPPITTQYPRVTTIALKQQSGYARGYMINTGRFGNKSRMPWLINEPDLEAKPLRIPEYTLHNYMADSNRDERGDLIALLREFQRDGVPCFYVLDDQEEIYAFGHTRMFRLPYGHSIKEFVQQNIEEGLDMTEALFGKVGKGNTAFASRVFFEDAVLCEGQRDVLLKELSPKILSSPKPTTFQHYLEQRTDSLATWNHPEKSVIRGHKLYWHRDVNTHTGSWSEDEVKHKSAQHTRIRPVKTGTRFSGRIRFENLSCSELGGLLFVLNLPRGLVHKLGMGKPLGLGSVKIQTQLILSDRRERYLRLFDSKGQWHLAERKAEIGPFQQVFEDVVMTALMVEGHPLYSSLWDTPRLKELRHLLSWKVTENKEWLDCTRYMVRDEFRERPVLPGTAEVSEGKDILSE